MSKLKVFIEGQCLTFDVGDCEAIDTLVWKVLQEGVAFRDGQSDNLHVYGPSAIKKVMVVDCPSQLLDAALKIESSSIQ